MADFLLVDMSTSTILDADKVVVIDNNDLSESEAAVIDYGDGADIHTVAEYNGYAVLDCVRAVDQIWDLMKNSPDWNADTLDGIATILVNNNFNHPGSN